MAISTALKTKMENGDPLVYDIDFYIQDDNDDYISFMNRNPVVTTIKIHAEGTRRHQVVATSSKVILDNADQYFDYMDDPSDGDTSGLFGDYADDFIGGFHDRLSRITVRMKIGSSIEEVSLGTYRISDVYTDWESGKATIELYSDIQAFKDISPSDMADGRQFYENRPVEYLVREMLKKRYPEGISGKFDITEPITIENNSGDLLLSHYGKPPELDSNGIWRNDITEAPTCLFYDSEDDVFLIGIGDSIWSYDPDTGIYTKAGGDTFTSDRSARFMMSFSSQYILILAWKNEASSMNRYSEVESAYYDRNTGNITLNSSGNFVDTFTGDFVLRDTYDSSAPLLYYGTNPCVCGLVENSQWENGLSQPIDPVIGVNMPIPLPQTIVSLCEALNRETYGEWQDWGFDNDCGLRGNIPGAGWTRYDPAATPQDENHASETGFLAFAGCADRLDEDAELPGLWVYMGTGRNFAAVSGADLNGWSDPYLFSVETDGATMGVDCVGTVDIVAYNAYTGTTVTVTSASFTGADAPIYSLVFIDDGTNDYLAWIAPNWGEQELDLETDSTNSLVMSHKIKYGQLSDNGGDPYLDVSTDISTHWTAGMNTFSGDDADFIPVCLVPYKVSGTQNMLVVLIDPAAINDAGGGGDSEPYKLYTINNFFGLSSQTELRDSLSGWGNITDDPDNSRLLMNDRDTGRVLVIDYSGGNPTASDVSWLDEGFEAVPGASFEMPGCGIEIRTNGSDTEYWGISAPALPPMAQEDGVQPEGKYYLWHYAATVPARVPMFDNSRPSNLWDALGLLAEVCDYKVGIDPVENKGFFEPIPDGTASADITLNLDSVTSRAHKVIKRKGHDRVINKVTFIPYESYAEPPTATVDTIGYIGNGGSAEHFNGETEVRSETTIQKRVVLHCREGGDIGSAVFVYAVYTFAIKTALSEDVSTLNEIEVDSITDIEAGMAAQVADYDGASDDMTVSSISDAGLITLSENLDSAYEKGTPCVFKDVTYGDWSDEYDTPDTFTPATSWTEIGDTGLFLKFTADDSDPHPFAVGDRITIENPGLQLRKDQSVIVTRYDATSRDKYGLKEYAIDNPFMSEPVGRQRADYIIANDNEPKYILKITWKGLLLHAKPMSILELTSQKLFPLATDNTVKFYIISVMHKLRSGETEMEIIGVDNY